MEFTLLIVRIQDALKMLEPLCKDRVDLTRQGWLANAHLYLTHVVSCVTAAMIAMAMVLIQHNEVKEPKCEAKRLLPNSSLVCKSLCLQSQDVPQGAG